MPTEFLLNARWILKNVCILLRPLSCLAGYFSAALLGTLPRQFRLAFFADIHMYLYMCGDMRKSSSSQMVSLFNKRCGKEASRSGQTYEHIPYMCTYVYGLCQEASLNIPTIFVQLRSMYSVWGTHFRYE